MMKRIIYVLQNGYARLKKVSYFVGNLVSTVIFSLIYILILPWFAFFAKKSKRSKLTNWHAWSFREDTVEDLRKQY